MAWRLQGRYFECRALLAYHVESGEVDGVDVSSLNFALFLDTPPVPNEGNRRVGVFLDEAVSDRQAARLGLVLSGQAGGPPAMLGPLIGEMPGVQKARITYHEDGRGHHVSIADTVDVGFAAPFSWSG